MSDAAISDRRDSETLILIGMTDPGSLLDGAFRHALVVEPDPVRARALTAAHEGEARIQVLEAALSDRQGEEPLIVYNQPGLRGFRPPSAHLRKLFPGLRERTRQTVRRIGAADVFRMAGPPEPPVRLWLDAGGEEAESLAALEMADLLDPIARITLRCGATPLFDDASGAAELTSWLQRHGFVLDARDDSDPDWPVLDFIRPPVFWAFKESEARREFLESRLIEYEADTAALQERLSVESRALKDMQAVRNRVETQLAERDTELAALQEQTQTERAELKAQAVGLQNALDGARAHSADVQRQLTERTERVKVLVGEQQELRDTNEALGAKVAELQDQISQIESDRDEVRTLAQAAQADKDQRIAELEATHEATAAKLTALQDQISQIGAERDRFQTQAQEARASKEARIEELKDAEATIRSDLAVALRMQSVAQADLRELQMRYQEADSDRRRQSDLLKALTPRLQQAAAQLQLLTQSEVVSPEQLTKAAPKTRRKTASSTRTTKTATKRKPGGKA